MAPFPLTRQDLHRLRRELLLLVALILLTALLHGSSKALESVLQQKLTVSRQNMQKAQSQLAQVAQELTDLQLYRPHYQRLLERQIVGSEQRLTWMEILDSIQENHQLPGMKYSFGRQQRQAVSAGLTLTQHQILSSPMTLTTFTLHEGQLLDALSDLQQQTSGLPLLRSCEMRPHHDVARHEATKYNKARIHTVCHYDWLSLQASP